MSTMPKYRGGEGWSIDNGLDAPVRAPAGGGGDRLWRYLAKRAARCILKRRLRGGVIYYLHVIKQYQYLLMINANINNII